MAITETLTSQEPLVDAVNAAIDFWEWYGINHKNELISPDAVKRGSDEAASLYLPVELMSKKALRAIRRGTYSLVFGDDGATDDRARLLREAAFSDLILHLSANPDITLKEVAPLMFSRRFTAKVRRSLFDLALLITEDQVDYST